MCSSDLLPLSSLRYEAEREGLEDCELALMVVDALEARGLTHDAALAHVRELVKDAVPDFRDYTRSWHELEAARARLIAELLETQDK